jgi:hypothetical protein
VPGKSGSILTGVFWDLRAAGTVEAWEDEARIKETSWSKGMCLSEIGERRSQNQRV